MQCIKTLLDTLVNCLHLLLFYLFIHPDALNIQQDESWVLIVST